MKQKTIPYSRVSFDQICDWRMIGEKLLKKVSILFLSLVLTTSFLISSALPICLNTIRIFQSQDRTLGYPFRPLGLCSPSSSTLLSNAWWEKDDYHYLLLSIRMVPSLTKLILSLHLSFHLWDGVGLSTSVISISANAIRDVNESKLWFRGLPRSGTALVTLLVGSSSNSAGLLAS